MKKNTRFLLAIFLILATYGQSKGKDLEFSTTQIREMWFICSTELRRKIPNIPEGQKVYLCDCYVNQLRMKFTSEEFLNLSKDESYKLGLEFSKMCNGDINNESFAVVDPI